MFMHRYRHSSPALARERRTASNHRHDYRPVSETLEGRLLLAADISIRSSAVPLADRFVLKDRSHTPSLSQPGTSRLSAPDIRIASARGSGQQYSLASRQTSLMQYARSLVYQTKGPIGTLTDAQALGMLIYKSFSLQNPNLPIAKRVNDAIEDLGDVIGGGVPFSLGGSKFNYASKKGGRFHDSGFAPAFQDGSDQVRHFIGGLVLGYRLGSGPLANSVANSREEIERWTHTGYSPGDVNLNKISTNLGAALKAEPPLIYNAPGFVQQSIEPPSPPSTSSYSDTPPGTQPTPTPTPTQPPYVGTWSGSYSDLDANDADETPIGTYSGSISLTIDPGSSGSDISGTVSVTGFDVQQITCPIVDNINYTGEGPEGVGVQALDPDNPEIGVLFVGNWSNNNHAIDLTMFAVSVIDPTVPGQIVETLWYLYPGYSPSSIDLVGG